MSYQVIICFMLQDNSNSQVFLAFPALLNLPVLSFSNFPNLKKKPTIVLPFTLDIATL